MDQVEVAGLRVAYRRAGDGAPLVLVHGGMSDSREWRRQLEGLSDEFGVVAWDAPGCGGSDDPPASWRLPDYADCLAGLIRALELGRSHVVGLSWGGGLALELYRRHPQLARTLVLVSAYAGWAGSLPPEVVAERLRRVTREAELPPADWAPGYLDGLFTDAAAVELREEALSIMLGTRPSGTRPMVQGFAEADLREVLPRIQVPTLLLYGEADRRSPPEVVARDLHAKIPGSRLVVMAGVGHQCDMEAPGRFNAEVRSFLRSVAH
ncbi:MAG: alpha/beta hydrolase [Nocardiopsaceae bacterium]|jgi:pimeloyl-ACP methyl ester carboxylesterase|nr:alpha/beta hydrolase [Nocardiopsaceae bacterium]